MDRIREKISEYSFESEGRIRISCSDAFRIAAELGIQPAEVGKVCQQDDIRIVSCTLGCF